MDKSNKNYAKKFKVEEAKELAFLCEMDQKEMKKYLSNVLEQNYLTENNPGWTGDGYLYYKGDIPVCLVAHMDTTPTVRCKTEENSSKWYSGFFKKEKDILTTSSRDRRKIEYISEKVDDKGKHIYQSPQGIGGDDRCGIYTILRILEKGYRPSVLFCEDEEIGCVGSGKFCKSNLIDDLKEMKFLVQIDRRGNNDCVFYEDRNEEFHKWVEEVTGYETAQGSCTDIVNLSEACEVSSVNLSSGYYDEHTEWETVCIEELLHTIDAVETLLLMSEEVEQFKYETWSFSSYGYGYYGGIYGDDYNYTGYSRNWFEDDKKEVNEKKLIGIFEYGGEIYEVDGLSEMECVGKFLYENPYISWSEVDDWQIYDAEEYIDAVYEETNKIEEPDDKIAI